MKLNLIKGCRGSKHLIKPKTQYLKNSALAPPDGFPLSGRGYLQRYTFDEETISYDAQSIHLPSWASIGPAHKGLNEKTFGILDNYSNTSVFTHDDKLYTIFETKCAVEIDQDTLLPIKETTFDNFFCNFLNVHGYNDTQTGEYWTFSHMGMHLVIHQIKDSKVLKDIHLPLRDIYYIHDMIVTDDHIIFPSYPCSIDMIGSVFGSIVDSIEFKDDECLHFFLYDRHSHTTHRIKFPNIHQPAFHAKGYSIAHGKLRIHAFILQNGFQFKNIETRYDFNSQCITIDIDTTTMTCVNLTLHSQIGDMPSFHHDTQTLAYVSMNTLTVLDSQLNSQSRYFEDSILEEPEMVVDINGHLRIILLIHVLRLAKGVPSTELHIINTHTLESESIWCLPFETPNGFHGLLI